MRRPLPSRDLSVICLLSFFFFCHPAGVLAQDANYWTSNYGPGGFLTPGAVIAYNKDSGVLFYNPALLAWSKKSSASISGSIYQLENINIRNGVGSGLGLEWTAGSIIPQLVAGTLVLHGKKKMTLSYSLIRNPISSFEVTQRKDARFDVLNDSYSPGPETFIGQYSARNSITETYAQLSAGWKLSEAFSAGIAIEGRIRRQSFQQNFSSRALYNVATDTVFPPIASVTLNYIASYTQMGMRFKAGLSYNASVHHLGLMVTTPQVNLYGNATLYADQEVSNIQFLPPQNFNLLASTRQTGLNARWKTPFQAAAGYAFDYSGNGQIYISGEYFGRIPDYNVITPRNEYFVRPDTSAHPNTASLVRFKDVRKPVFNFSIGVSFPLTEDVLGYCSFRSDFTYADSSIYRDTEGFTANATQWDNWHLQIGANFKRRKFNFRPGLLLSYGSTRKFLQPVNFDDPHEVNLLQGTPHYVKGSRFAAGLMFSYIHNF